MGRNWKRHATAALIALCSFAGLAFAAADDAIGTWQDTETGATFSVYSCNGLCIKIVKPSADLPKDKNNPDPALRDRSMAGVVILSGAQKDGDDRWKGNLYNGEDGKTYTGYVIVTGKDEIKLEGCVLAGIICKSRVWKRT